MFERNRFEQFCINYVNEKLQQIFIDLTIKEEQVRREKRSLLRFSTYSLFRQDEYQREGIRWNPISYPNNQQICDLFEGKTPPGMFLLLDDICTSSHASSEKADRHFLDVNQLRNILIKLNRDFLFRN